ncbi:MAG: P-II family nitrogen regulator [Nitrososphaeraceae archaeon]
MIRIEVVTPRNHVKAISEGLKEINVGGVTALKVRGRGKTEAPKIHAFLGTEIFTPEFSEKYLVQVVVPENKENDVIRIVRENSKIGKIFISQLTRAIDITTGIENEQAI